MSEILDLLRRVGEHSDGMASALGILLRVTVLLLATALVAFALRRSSAAMRHLVWSLSLAGTLFIPLCSWVLPAWHWAVLPQRPPAKSPAPVAAAAPALSTPIARVADDVPLKSAGHIAGRPRPFAEHATLPAVESTDRISAAPATPPAIAGHPPVTPAPQAMWSWPAIFAVFWAAGTFLGLAWLAIGAVAAWHVARRAQANADSRWHGMLRELLDQCGIRRAVEVRECSQVSVPMTWGVLRPVVLVPAGSAAWSEPIKRSVLLHELGHIRRGDCLVLLLGRLACAAYWFHPLAWLAVRQLRKTSEQAADDLVLASRIAPPDYAEHLVGIAAQMRGLRLFGHVALPMASRSDLEGRVLAILDPRRNHRSVTRRACYTLALLAALLVLPCAILRLGYAEDKKPQEAGAASKDGLAASQPAAEKGRLPNPDDRAARPELAVAEAKYNAARAKAEDDISVRYAIAGAAEAKAEYEYNKKANEKVPGSLPPKRLNELALKCKEMDLVIEKATLDQRIARAEAEFAKAEFEAAKRPENRKIQREMEVVEAEAKYHEARIKADDDINVRYAIAAAGVAEAEYEYNKKANADVPGSVPGQKLDELSLKCKEADLAIEKAKRDQRVAGEEAKVAKAELEAAKRKAAEDRPTSAATKGTRQSGPAKAGTTSAAPAAAPLLSARGEVVDSAGKPVVGVAVYLRERLSDDIVRELRNQNMNDIVATTQTDEEGKFRFENVRGRPFINEKDRRSKSRIIPWDVVVIAKPYAIAWQHLTAEQQSKPMTFKMSPEATITGRVTDDKGRAVPNAEARVLQIRSLSPSYISLPELAGSDPETLDLKYSRLAPAGKTDAQGNVLITGLPRGVMLEVQVRHDDREPQSLHVATTDKPQPAIEGILGEAIDMEKREMIGVRKTFESVYSAAFSVKLGPPLPRFAGRIVAADSKKPLPQTLVDGCGTFPNWFTVADQEGRFAVNWLRPRNRYLWIKAPDGSDYLDQFLVFDLPQETIVNPPNEKQEVPLDIELTRGEILTGTVSDVETGKGLAGFGVSFDNRFTRKHDGGEPILYRATTDNAGRFRLAVPPGKGNILICRPGDDPEWEYGGKSEKQLSGKETVRRIEVLAGKPRADLTVKIHHSRNVMGTVLDPDARPAAGADVGLSSWFSDNDGEFHPVQTDAQGRFAFRRISDHSPLNPTETVLAIDRGRKLRGHVQIPNVSPAASKEDVLTIRLVPTGVVKGRVLKGEKPISGAFVQFNSVPGYVSYSTQTDPTGQFEFPMVEACSETMFLVQASGQRTGLRRPTSVLPGQTLTLDESLGPVVGGHTLEVKPFIFPTSYKAVGGVVTDPNGKPVEGLDVEAFARSDGHLLVEDESQTGHDGHFFIKQVPDVPLTLIVFKMPTNRFVDFAHLSFARKDAEPGQMDVRIVFEPKQAQGKKK